MELIVAVLLLVVAISILAPFFVAGFTAYKIYDEHTLNRGEVVLIESVEDEAFVSFKGLKESGDEGIMRVKINESRIEEFEIGDKVFFDNNVLIVEEGEKEE